MLRAWLGDGQRPVDRLTACHRADLCASCVLNREVRWSELVKLGIARAILEQVKIKNGMRLDLCDDREKKIGMCDACGCYLRLKVWVPIEHIGVSIDDEEMAALDKDCWIRNELWKRLGQNPIASTTS